MDPTLLALVSIFGGVTFTALAGFAGAWIQSRREHIRWIRERRLDAYVNFLVVVQAFDADRREAAANAVDIEELAGRNAENHAKYEASDDSEERARLAEIGEELNRELEILIKMTERATARIAKVQDSLVEKSVPFHLLGPQRVRELAYIVDDTDPDGDAYAPNLLRLQVAMRGALRIKD